MCCCQLNSYPLKFIKIKNLKIIQYLVLNSPYLFEFVVDLTIYEEVKIMR